jgi:hypothetical protein
MNPQQQSMPPSQPKPGMSGGAPAPSASPSAMGVKGNQRTQADPQKVQQELARGAQGVSQALYSNEQTSNAVLKMFRPEEKVGSTAKAAMMAASQVIEKAGIAERVAVPLAVMAADEVMQMVEATGQAQFSEPEAKQVIMSTAEMMLSAYGVSPERAQMLAEQASPEQRSKMEQVYRADPSQGGAGLQSGQEGAANA